MKTSPILLCNAGFAIAVALVSLSSKAWSAGAVPVCSMGRDVGLEASPPSPMFASNGCAIETKVRAAANIRQVSQVAGRGSYHVDFDTPPATIVTRRSMENGASVATIQGRGSGNPAPSAVSDTAVATNQ